MRCPHVTVQNLMAPAGLVVDDLDGDQIPTLEKLLARSLQGHIVVTSRGSDLEPAARGEAGRPRRRLLAGVTPRPIHEESRSIFNQRSTGEQEACSVC